MGSPLARCTTAPLGRDDTDRRVMAKPAESFVCQSCGAAYGKWQGRCDACGEWNSILAEAPKTTVPKGLSAGKGKAINFAALSTQPDTVVRTVSGIEEFDRVLGGGLVPGSAILHGGDPGLGKSTLQLGRASCRERVCPYV